MTHRSRAQHGDPLQILAHAAGYATFAARPGAARAAKPLLEMLVSMGITRAYSGVGGPKVAELHDVREDPQADLPLLLLCAEDNEVALVHLVDVLNRSGRAPEVIAGVEHDTALLSAAADRTPGAALFVLCQSQELDQAQVLRLSGLFSARKGPLHKLLVVDVSGSASLDALPQIEAAMESVSSRTSASAEASVARAANVPRRDVVVMPGTPKGRDRRRRVDSQAAEAASGGTDAYAEGARAAMLALQEAAEREARETAEREDRVNSENLARAFHEEMVAAEAMLERRSIRRGAAEEADELPSYPREGLGRELGDGVPVAVESDQAQTRPLGVEEPTAIEVSPSPEPIGSPADDAEHEPVVDDHQPGALTTSLSGVRDADPLAFSPAAPPDTIQTELTPTDTRRRRQEPEQTDTHEAAHVDEESRGGWWLAMAGAAALGGLALFVMGGGSSGDDGGQRSASVAATRSGGTKAPRSFAADRTGGAHPGADDVAAPNVQATDAERPPVDAAAGAELPPTTHADGSAVSASPPAPSDSEALRVDLAIRSGKIRALDSLLVARASLEEVDWRQAKAACRRKRVGNLPGWHLPSRRQLNRLRRSRVIRDGTYWSRQRGPHDDDAFAVDASSGSSHVYLAIEPAARAQCVRER